jgi:deoxyribonuclease V
MEVDAPAYAPDAALSTDEMEALQREIAAEAVFSDDLPPRAAGLAQDATADPSTAETEPTPAPPLVAGIDQAFVGDSAVSAVVLLRDGEVVECADAVAPTDIPYIPGLLSFREGGAIIAALQQLSRRPDVALFDGSGRLHYREAGLATHIGLMFDIPAVGVAKSLLCGTPARDLDERFEVGTRVEIRADDSVTTAPNGTTLGYAVQTRQFESGERYVNPVYVSPGHRVGAATAASLAEACCDGYKLPEPTRQADSDAGELCESVSDSRE